MYIYWPSLKSALRPPPSALAESANFRPFYVKRADFSPPPPATKKRRKLVQIRPRCLHLATTKRRKVVKIRPCGGWWVGGWPPPPFCLNLILSSNRSKYGKIKKKHRKNCKCCPGHSLIVNHYSSISWFKFRNLSVIVNCVPNSLNGFQSKSRSLSL